ncbi:ATP phosphoribosyltransferase [Collinsella ihumii]|uniref:ATP phosphoribosyltransferase regulatory subunit n=1 Tax=Collinsella ihumii TaxID=1720204 RepID=A0ABT7XD86_9ACTN|nr:ATP phosphoribosyltransferase [Collinsella ihumii]MDN0063365.1 ATP phosphoribosyltransferase [Collinsella ihumii]
MTATPWGFRDILPEEAQAREDIALTVKNCLKAHRYLPVETPLLEDKSALEQGGHLADTPFKLFDDDGRFLVVRPDNTLSIVRLVSSRMSVGDLPLRLRYEAPVVRAASRNSGTSRQFTQLGYELIGAGGAAGDAEIVSIAVEVVRELGLPGWRLVCGSVLPIKALLSCCADADLARRVLEFVHANNLVDLDACVRASGEDEAFKRAVCALPRLSGGIEVLDEVDALLEDAGVGDSATDELRALYGAVSAMGEDVRARLTFDFSILNSFDYYTGLLFKVYAAGMPDSVGSGGRYDTVLDGAIDGVQRVPAAGFAFSLERLEAVRPDEKAVCAGGDGAIPRDVAAPLRIAVPKGSLNADTLRVLEAAGLDVSALRDPGRHLIFRARDTREGDDSIGEVEYIIVRPTDAPAFVACGGADCGICGRDSLIEADLNLLQLIDLQFGACRFIEAEPAWRAGEAERAYARRGSLRVATKYPRIASAWYEERGVNADIISLHGNIELGPIVGLSDRIVDITATGTTLRENDLVITGEIMECTARFFVNPGRARLDGRVRRLAERLAAVVARG